MKSRNRFAFSLCLALLSGTCLGAPSSAQKGETAALSAKIDVLSRAGKYAEAAALAQGQLQAMQKKYGPVHRDVAAAMNNLAQLYGEQGNDADAEPLFKQAIAIMEKAAGVDEVAPELNNLAALYQRRERYAEAEPLFKRALAIRERSLGRDHPDVGQSLNNLATLNEKLGRHGDSEPLFKRALAIYEKAAGPEHPAVATLLNNLGQVDKVQGRYAEAEPLIKRSLAIREKVLGRDHPDVARSLNNLADLYERQGRYADALPLYQRAAALREAQPGPPLCGACGTGDRRPDRGGVGDVGQHLGQPEPGRTSLQHGHVVPALGERPGHPGAEHPARPGDQDLHRPPASTRPAHAATAARSILELCRMSTGRAGW